jgi:long-chain acyl-CoA synthetase
MNLGDLVERQANRHPDKTALHFQGEQVTYAELDRRINRVANALVDLGIGKGDRVAVQIGNRPDFVYSYYGITRTGAALVPLNVMYKAGEVEYIANDSGIKAIICDAPLYPVTAAARAKIASLEHVIVAREAPDDSVLPLAAILERPQDARPQVDIDPEEIAVICYTSGTTGRPKGAMLTHNNLISNCEPFLTLPRCALGPDDVGMLVLPLFHIYGMNVTLGGATLVGGTAVIIERFDAELVLSTIEQMRVTVFYGAPPMYIAMNNLETDREFDLSSLRGAFSGAAALPVPVLERFNERYGVMIMEGYGLTETSPVVCTNAAGHYTKPGSIGPTLEGVECKVFDDNDRELPTGEVGELVVRGPNVFKGYLNMPEETAAAMSSGWFHTGDLARVDEDEYYYIVDRKKEMVLVSGFNVYPREVEEVLYRHPKVADAAIIGVPDDYSGERVKAVIALRSGEVCSADEIMAYCQENLATFKCPKEVEFRDQLPKLPTGKVAKLELKGGS